MKGWDALIAEVEANDTVEAVKAGEVAKSFKQLGLEKKTRRLSVRGKRTK